MVGVIEYSDDELIEELEQLNEEDESLLEAKAEQAVYKELLKGGVMNTRQELIDYLVDHYKNEEFLREEGYWNSLTYSELQNATLKVRLDKKEITKEMFDAGFHYDVLSY